MILLALLLASADAKPDAALPPPSDKKVRCKYQPVIGSIAQTVKECHTVTDWEALRRGTQDEARRIMSSAASSRSN